MAAPASKTYSKTVGRLAEKFRLRSDVIASVAATASKNYLKV
jgi:hypothetical protein